MKIKGSKGIFILLGLGLSMTLLACTSQADTPAPGVSPTNVQAVTSAATEILPPAQSRGSGLAGAEGTGGNVPAGVKRTSMPATAGVIEQVGLPAPSTVEDLPIGAMVARTRGLAGSGAGDSGVKSTGILVTGRGEVSVPPDLAILNLGVQAFAGSVAVARNDAATAMGKVTQVLKARNIPDRDLQTRFFNINPRYTTREVTRCPKTKGTTSREVQPGAPSVSTMAPSVPGERVVKAVPKGPTVETIARLVVQEECFKDRERVIIGYEVSNQLTVKIRNLEEAGEIIDEVTEAGGDLTRFQGIRFSIDDPEALKDRARTAAIKDLMAKANQVATVAGVKLGNLIHISETGGATPPPFPGVERFAMAAVADAAPTTIMGGELNVVVTVQALYAIE